MPATVTSASPIRVRANAPLAKVSVVQIAAAASLQAGGGERLVQARQRGGDLGHRQRLADHPGRGDEHVLELGAEQGGRGLGLGPHRRIAGLAHQDVGVAGVDHETAGPATRQDPAAPGHRMPRHAGAGEQAGDRGAFGELDQQEIGAVAVTQRGGASRHADAGDRRNLGKALGRERRAWRRHQVRRAAGRTFAYSSGRVLVGLARTGFGRDLHRRAVEIEALDLGVLAQVGDQSDHDLARHLLAQARLGLLERRLARAAVQDLDHVPAELGLDRRLGALSGLEGECRLGELRHHLAAAEKAQVAAVRARRRVDRVLAGERGEVGAALQLRDHLLGLVLAADQDVPGVNLLLGEALVVLELVVARAQPVVGRALIDLAPDVGVAQDVGAGLGERRLHVGLARQVRLLRGIGQKLEIDRPVQQHAVDLRQRHLAKLLRQGAGDRLDVAAMDLAAVDDGDDRILGRGRLLRVDRQARAPAARC